VLPLLLHPWVVLPLHPHQEDHDYPHLPLKSNWPSKKPRSRRTK
jgi:hypothetical protein